MAFPGTALATLLVTVLLGADPLSGAGTADPAPAHAAAQPARVLVLGDSVSQGAAGDWTWRYRLWQHFVDSRVPVDLVGPTDGLYNPRTGSRGSHAYVDANFDRDHASRWGSSLTKPPWPIADLVADHRPDVVVIALGVNDLLLGRVDNPGLAAAALELGRAARVVDPGVRLVFAHVAQRWSPQARDLNERLDALAGQLGTGVAVARTDAGFQRIRDTYDGRHPSARGEVRFASAVADALATLGVGPAYARPLPRVPQGPRSAPEVRLRSGGGLVRLRWRNPPGVDREYLWQRDLTRGSGWAHRLGPQRGREVLLDGFVPGHRYAFRLQPARGFHRAARDVRSNVVSAVPAPR